MFDFGWSELTLLGVVALVVIGPKDLPKVLRTVGTYTRKARSIAREFQTSVEEMIRESELDDVKKHFDTARNFDIKSEINKAIDPDGSIREHLAPPVLPPVLPPVTMDPAPPPPPIVDAAEDPALPHPTIHTPIGSEPSVETPEGIDPHAPEHHAEAAIEPPQPVDPSAAIDPHPPAAPLLEPHPAIAEAAEPATSVDRERALPPVAP